MRLRLRLEGRHFDVPINVVAEWPDAVAALLEETKDPICPLLQGGLATIIALGANARRLTELLPILASCDNTWKEPAIEMQSDLQRAESVSARLEAYYRAHCDIVRRILAIEEDVLGAYFFGRSGRWVNPQCIEIYYPVIALVAPGLEVQAEDLTAVVLAHELAHAYSHLGYDIDEHAWDTDAFRTAEKAIVEGIAQYFTHRIAEKLRAENAEIWRAYENLLKEQPAAYRAHCMWIEGATPEAVRAALLVCRNQLITNFKEFEEVLWSSRDNLHGRGEEGA